MLKRSSHLAALAAAAILGAGLSPGVGSAPAPMEKAAPAPTRGAQRQRAGSPELDGDLLSRITGNGAWGASYPLSRPPYGALRIRREAKKKRNQARHRAHCRGRK